MGEPRCYFCSLLCPLGAERTKADRFLPQYPKREDGLRGLCGRGHTNYELVAHPQRRNLALVRTGGSERFLPLREGLAELAAVLKGVWDPASVALLVDGNVPAEDILAARLFAEQCLEGASWSVFLLAHDEALLRGLGPVARVKAVEELSTADATLVVGDPFTSHPVVAKLVLDAKLRERGVTLAVLDSVPNVTSGFATHWLCLPPGMEPSALAWLARRLGAPEEEVAPLLGDGVVGALAGIAGPLDTLAGVFGQAKRPVVLLAPEPTRAGSPARLAATARALAGATGARVLPLTCSGNARAAAAMAGQLGALPVVELLRRLAEGRLRALLVLGGDPAASLPGSLGPEVLDRLEVLAVAEALPTRTGEKATLVLPLALPTESAGTVVDAFGRRSSASPIALPPRGAVTIRELLSSLARELATELSPLPEVPLPALELPEALPAAELLAGGELPVPGEGELWLLGQGSSVHYEAGTLTGFARWARLMEPEPEAAVSPGTAQGLTAKPGQMLQLRTATGEVRVACVIREDLADGLVLVSGGCPEMRALFGWPVPRRGAVASGGPVPVRVEAAVGAHAESR